MGKDKLTYWNGEIYSNKNDPNFLFRKQALVLIGD